MVSAIGLIFGEKKLLSNVDVIGTLPRLRVGLPQRRNKPAVSQRGGTWNKT